MPPPKHYSTQPPAKEERHVADVDPPEIDPSLSDDFASEGNTPLGLRGPALVEFRSHQALIAARQAKAMIKDAIVKDDARFDSLERSIDDHRESTDERFGELTEAMHTVAIESAVNSSNVARMTNAVEDLTRIQTEKAIGDIRVGTTRETTKLEDEADAKKVRRGLIAKIVSGVIASGALGALVHHLLGKL